MGGKWKKASQYLQKLSDLLEHGLMSDIKKEDNTLHLSSWALIFISSGVRDGLGASTLVLTGTCTMLSMWQKRKMNKKQSLLK